MSTAPASDASLSGRLPAKVILPLAVCTLIWGSTWTAIRYQLGTVDHNWSIAYRFGIAAVTMYVLARHYRAPLKVRRDQLALVTGVAVMQFLLNFIFVYAAESYIASGLVAMVFALLVVPNAIFGWLFMGLKVGRSFIVGTVLAVAGMALLFHPQIGDVGGGDDRVLLGVALTLGAVCSASIGNLLQATKRAGEMHWATLLLWAMGLAALFNAVLAIILTGAPQWDPRPSYWIATVYLGLLGTALSFPVYLIVIRLIGPARAAYSGIIIPIVAMGFSTVLEGYRWTPEAIGGSVLAVIGLYFALSARKPAT